MKPLKSKKLAGLIRQGSALLPLSARSQGLATNVSNAELEPQLGTTASPGPASAASRLSTPAGQATRQHVLLDGSKEVQFETGRLAQMAAGSCVAIDGDTQVLAAVVCQPSPISRAPYPSLTNPFRVEYLERGWVSGRIPGTLRRREMTGERETATAALIEDALRPLFPEGFESPCQVDIQVMSWDGSSDLEVLALNAASAALACSSVPWNGPAAAVRVTRQGKHLNASASKAQLAEADGWLLYAGTAQGPVILQAQEGSGGSEDTLASMLALGHKQAVKLLQAQQQLAQAHNPVKQEDVLCVQVDAAAARAVSSLAHDHVAAVLRDSLLTTAQRVEALRKQERELHDRLERYGRMRFQLARVPGSGTVSSPDLSLAWRSLVSHIVSNMAVHENLRADGRGLLDCRRLLLEEGVLSSAHASALVSTGESQMLATLTLGSVTDRQVSHSAAGRTQERLLLQAGSYGFAGNMLPTRRWKALNAIDEIVASALLQKSLATLLPDEAMLPFTSRIAVDSLGSNGSSAALAVTAASLLLTGAHMPLRQQSLVAGVSLALLQEQLQFPSGNTPRVSPDSIDEQHLGQGGSQKRWEVVADPSALEEDAAECLLSVAGTRTGVTALHMQACSSGIPVAVLTQALQQARRVRMKTLDAMQREHEAAQAQHGKQARFGSMSIPREQIAKVIGMGGATIRRLEAQTGAKLIVPDSADGGSAVVHFFAPSQAHLEAVEQALADTTGASIKAGQVYVAEVVNITDFGAFMRLPNGYEALLHISELSHERVRSVGDELALGQVLEVMCLGQDSRGHVRLSRKPLLTPRETNPSAYPRTVRPAGTPQNQAGDASGQQPLPGGAASRPGGVGETHAADMSDDDDFRAADVASSMRVGQPAARPSQRRGNARNFAQPPGRRFHAHSQSGHSIDP